MSRQQIVCFGCGCDAEEFLNLYKDKVDIKYFLDNGTKQVNARFGSYSRYEPEVELCKGQHIVITNTRYYRRIAEQLSEYGLSEYKDFIHWEKFAVTILSGDWADEESWPLIKIWFEDFWEGFDTEFNFIYQILNRHYRVILDPKQPDYLFCSVFGYKALMFNCPRILFIGENVSPDFDLYDYAVGCNKMIYGDRYVRIPLYMIYPTWKTAVLKNRIYDWGQFEKRGFCCRVVSNGRGADPFREQFYKELDSSKRVDSGGKYANNLPGGKPVRDKAAFLKGYKFNLAFENSYSSEYTTEKIVDAWAAGAIPIYWGNYRIDEEFNEKAFVNCHRFTTRKEAVEYILDLEQDHNRLKAILSEPILKEDIKENVLEDFIIHIIGKPKQDAIQRTAAFGMWAKRKERFYRQNCN